MIQIPLFINNKSLNNYDRVKDSASANCAIHAKKEPLPFDHRSSKRGSNASF